MKVAILAGGVGTRLGGVVRRTSSAGGFGGAGGGVFLAGGAMTAGLSGGVWTVGPGFGMGLGFFVTAPPFRAATARW